MTDPLFSVGTPPVDSQVKYWDSWNLESRAGSLDFHCTCIRDEAMKWAATMGPHPHILEVGCGTGWLSDSLASVGETVGVDLSPRAIAHAEARGGKARFMCGDFMTLDLPQPFDMVVTADSISHVPDHKAFVNRCADLLRPDGRLVLMSQNEFVYRRCSWVQPPSDGLIRRWPTRAELRTILHERFIVEHSATVAPLEGNKGILRLANSKYGWGLVRRIVGHERGVRLFSQLGWGSELLFVARRR